MSNENLEIPGGFHVYVSIQKEKNKNLDLVPLALFPMAPHLPRLPVVLLVASSHSTILGPQGGAYSTGQGLICLRLEGPLYLTLSRPNT